MCWHFCLFFPFFYFFFFCLISETHCHVAPWEMSWYKRNATFSVAPGVILGWLWSDHNNVQQNSSCPRASHRGSDSFVSMRPAPCGVLAAGVAKTGRNAIWLRSETKRYSTDHMCRCLSSAQRERPCDEPQIFISPQLHARNGLCIQEPQICRIHDGIRLVLHLSTLNTVTFVL